MSLSIKTVRQPCTSNATPKIVCPPTKCNKILNMKVQALKKFEHLFVDSNINNSLYRAPTPVKLRERWMDYQGIKNWEGLLDPLDHNLRSEIIRYGHFVEAAYRSFDFDPSSSSYAMCRYPKRRLLDESGFPETGYRVTKNLVATSGIQLPGWIQKAPSWMAMQASWIGYTAVCHDSREISRLGRRDVVIAFRGTATCLEWLENLRATLTPLSDDNSKPSEFSCPMVESGFLSLYTSSIRNRPSLKRQVREEVSRILKLYGNEPISFTFTGHSLGASLATLAAYDIKETFKNSPLVSVISFAGPRVGNRSFRSHLDRQGTKVLRIVNSDDLITKIPGFVIDNNDQMTNDCDHHMAQISTWIRKLVEDTQWVYADIGCELRLSSRSSPDLNDINIATCHELKTYLHLVNGFVSSNCPIKATARKMINETLLS
ncbi:phospholipase A(1) DAD1, chloroplastic-like [Olea europaea subsp. europaea]|uniref:Phospholipase A(1) DAD1, chloroplastic-like n=2 Tax=Olea europaea subsp. europaea TaxID=158383 RepID=A0A8S0UPN2_OLEEU|nr:phospholipase A(1) DAD1, chloroplastic-like [Olea europaea subsp. europaea]